MAYIKLPLKTTPGKLQEHNTPPFSIPNVALPHYEIHDDYLSKEQHEEVYKYLLGCAWHQFWSGINPELQLFRPNDWDHSWVEPATKRSTIGQPRTVFGSDEASVKKSHPIIGKLWDSINAKLNNEYSITGHPEGMVWQALPVPPTEDPTLKQGWRCYANGTRHDGITGLGHPHRDTPNLSDDTSVTMIYVASLEWYPSWGSEIILYPEDPDGKSGEHQQFNQSVGQQRRNFNVGWPDDGALISLRPNRLIIYDGRTMHTTHPSSNHNNNVMNMRVVFRARKIK